MAIPISIIILHVHNVCYINKKSSKTQFKEQKLINIQLSIIILYYSYSYSFLF
jgi:hypothetical protein